MLKIRIFQKVRREKEHKSARTAKGLILNLGCGTSNHKFDKIINVDIDKNLKNVKNFIIGDIKSLFFKKNTFDTILMIESLEHIEERYALSTLKQCFDMLKPNGRIIIHTPNRNRWTMCIRNPIIKKKYPIVISPTTIHYKEYTKKELENKLLETGFKNIKISVEFLYFPFFPEFGLDVPTRFGRDLFVEASKIL